MELIIYKPLGWLLGTIYNLIGSYGLSLIVFTIIIKTILFPLSIHQQKSMAKTAGLQPKMQEIQRKYRNNKEKQSQELMKLYKEEKVNPTMGCLPMLIQLPIIFGLYRVITRPLQYISGLSLDAIQNVVTTLNLVDTTGMEADKVAKAIETFAANSQIAVAKALESNLDKFPDLSGVTMIDFNLWGIDLAGKPIDNIFSVLLLIPVLAGITAFASSWYTANFGPSAAMATEQTKSMNRTMMFTMPLMSVWFTFSFEAGIGIYWIMSNVMMLVQQYVLNKLIPARAPKPLSKEEERKKRKQEQQEMLEEKRREKEEMKKKLQQMEEETEQLEQQAQMEEADEDEEIEEEQDQAVQELTEAAEGRRKLPNPNIPVKNYPSSKKKKK